MKLKRKSWTKVTHVRSSRVSERNFNVADAVLQKKQEPSNNLWNEQIDQINSGDRIKIENGYITSFKSEIQLNIGKYGKFTIL